MSAAAAQAAEVTTFDFLPAEAPPVRVFIAVPQRVSARTRIMVVLHGTLRNADEYVHAWPGWAARTGHVVVAPEFDRRRWPGGRSYNLGNVFSDSGGRGELVPEGRWAFTVVEELVGWVRRVLKLPEEAFALWGHSAGAQFIHRFLLFRPRAPVQVAFAAGCGWFTLPDAGRRFPYGLRHPLLRFGAQELEDYLRRPLVIMRAELDTERDVHLRTTRGAERQGRNRFERAGRAYEVAQALDAGCRWRLVTVPGVGHDWVEMARAAQELWPP
jgi:poly(3-hydroxybutyrate) depolymerase